MLGLVEQLESTTFISNKILQENGASFGFSKAGTFTINLHSSKFPFQK